MVCPLLASIFSHYQVDYTMVSFYKGYTLDHNKALEFMTVNTSDSTFSVSVATGS